MKKLVAMLCVAGLLTGCAVGGEKKTEEVKPETPVQTEEKTDTAAKPEEKPAEEETEGDVMPDNFRGRYAPGQKRADFRLVRDLRRRYIGVVRYR